MYNITIWHPIKNLPRIYINYKIFTPTLNIVQYSIYLSTFNFSQSLKLYSSFPLFSEFYLGLWCSLWIRNIFLLNKIQSFLQGHPNNYIMFKRFIIYFKVLSKTLWSLTVLLPCTSEESCIYHLPSPHPNKCNSKLLAEKGLVTSFWMHSIAKIKHLESHLSKYLFIWICLHKHYIQVLMFIKIINL